jgi:hypothetical protein
MSRKMVLVAIVVAVLLAALVVPAAANPLEAVQPASAMAEAWSGFSGRLPVLPLRLQLTGGGSCGGAGSCPT